MYSSCEGPARKIKYVREFSIVNVHVCVMEFYVTCNDISVIYVTAQMCRRTEEEVVLTVGLQTQ